MGQFIVYKSAVESEANLRQPINRSQWWTLSQPSMNIFFFSDNLDTLICAGTIRYFWDIQVHIKINWM